MQVASWQALARVARLGSLGCFLAAFELPASPAAALLVMSVQGGGRESLIAIALVGWVVAAGLVTAPTVTHPGLKRRLRNSPPQRRGADVHGLMAAHGCEVLTPAPDPPGGQVPADCREGGGVLSPAI
jgi:hypothetical protein